MNELCAYGKINKKASSYAWSTQVVVTRLASTKTTALFRHLETKETEKSLLGHVNVALNMNLNPLEIKIESHTS